MRVRKYLPLLFLVVTAPAFGASQDFEGWFGSLDLALTQPNSLDHQFANHVDFSGATPSTERLVIDNDDSLAVRLSFGYSWGSKGMLRVSYWGFDNDDEVSDTLNGGVYPTIFGYGTNGGAYIYNSAGVDFEAASDVEASAWDVDYLRPMEVGEKFTVKWLAGLRVANYDETQSFEGTDGVYTYFQEKVIESEAWGFRVGAGGTFEFTEHFALEAGLAVSFMQAEADGNTIQECSAGSVCDGTETREGNDNNVRGEIRDYGVRAVWMFQPLDVYVGYSASNWDGLVTDPVPSNDAGHFAQGPVGSSGRDSIAFNAWNAGIRFRFGGGG